MAYKRLFIVRKDLNMSTGKISAQLAHCAEVYWLKLLKPDIPYRNDLGTVRFYTVEMPTGVSEEYVKGAITKTVCECKNKNQLLKARDLAVEQGLIEGEDFGFIKDKCLTELMPEEEDGTTYTAFWTAPIPEEKALAISKKYHLYVD